MAMTSLRLDVLPSEMWCHIASFLERKDLSRSEAVNREWSAFFCTDIPWHSLFVRTFRELPPPMGCKGAFKERWGVQLVDSNRLLTAATEFWIRSNCGEPKRMVILSNPDCTTGKLHFFYLEYTDCLKEGEEGRPVRMCYFRYPGEVLGPHTDSVGRMWGAGASSELKYTTIVQNDNEDSEEALECRIERAPGICRDLIVYGANCINALYHLHPYTLCLWARIPLVLPDGWRLGFISSVDNWQKTGELNFASYNNDGKSLFTGFVPYGQIRFVKLYGDSVYIPEKQVSRTLTQPQDLNTSLSTSPIQFGEGVV